MKRKNKEIQKKAEQKEKKKQQQKRGISIGIQLMAGFLIPVVFVIAVGTISYKKAAEGLTNNYEASSRTALEMTMTTFDNQMQMVVSDVSELSQDATIMSYALGGFDSDSVKRANASKSISDSINVKETAGAMIDGIEIIPIDGDDIVTTRRLDAVSMESFITDMQSSEDGDLITDNFVRWGSSHPFVDEKMGIASDNYALYCSKSFSSGSNRAVLIIDISKASIEELLQKLDLGEGAQVSFITAENQEINSGAEISIKETDFYKEALQSGEESTYQYVNYEGKSYYFMMCKSATTDGNICVLVPKEVITKSSKDIETMTIAMVVAACMIAIFIGTLVTRSITKNIKRSMNRLYRVSQGELIEEKERKASSGSAEFGRLHGAIGNTVSRIRELVLAVKRMIEQVTLSGEKVSKSSENVGQMVSEVGTQVEEIRNNIEKEDEEIASCNHQMEELSVQIEMVSKSILNTIEQIENSKLMIQNGVGAVNDMTRQSKDTSQATSEVQRQVSQLGEKMEAIEEFVESIQRIAEETNLLSLNASIEAARAGENGKGFSVVAEEIRNLADSSAKTALSIHEIIDEIGEYSRVTIEQAKEAESIVELQEESVMHTAETFQSIHVFMEELMQNMNSVTQEVEKMNAERCAALESIRAIGEFSGNTVRSANEVSHSLEMQMQSADMLEQEAKHLEQNMSELQQAVAGFKLSDENKMQGGRK
ncbi:MAG: methyl-accepting chemotaxis protein [Lachnospiraceae bacterium]|nr:methyl-accepting chemotaxis protein [Lachnospiraceae bacterium]